jgi:hypothetical protein
MHIYVYFTLVIIMGKHVIAEWFEIALSLKCMKNVCAVQNNPSRGTNNCSRNLNNCSLQ